MLFSNKETLEDIVLKALLQKSYRAQDLLLALKQQGHSMSRQALYDILRKLTAAEVLVKHNVVYSTNLTWVHKVTQNLKEITKKNEYKEVNYLYDMRDGDSLTFHFSDPVNMDLFWGHIFLALGEIHPKHIPLVIYFPHPWIYYAREKTEREFFHEIKKNYLTFYTIGNTTPLDFGLKQEQGSDMLQFNIGQRLQTNPDHYINIQGDYIQEVVPSKKFSEEISAIFRTHSTRELASVALQKLLSEGKHHSKLIVRKNKKKAYEMRKRFAKNFVLQEGYFL